MTEVEIRIAKAIAPGLVTYQPGSATKRFARDMAWLAQNNAGQAITPKQARYLFTTAVRYRRQVPADIVELARSEVAAMEGAPA